MNLLTEKLPETVRIQGTEVPINTDFRVSISFELLMDDPELDDTEKLACAFALYYPALPSDIGEAVRQMIWFYQCGKEQRRSKKTGKALYRFDYDDTYIYAAFLSQYGVDLSDAHMHWWKFRAMFQGLNEDNEIVKIIGYRAMEISGKMSKEQKRFYMDMKERYKLPVSKRSQKLLDKVEEALLSGGDLAGIL